MGLPRNRARPRSGDPPRGVTGVGLHESLLECILEMKAGATVDAAEALAELRAHR